MGMGSKKKFASIFNLTNKGFLFVSLLLTYGGASVPRYDSAFHLAMHEVRAKHFSQDAANAKKINVVQPRASIIFLFVREMLRPYKCRQNHSGTGRGQRQPVVE